MVKSFIDVVQGSPRTRLGIPFKTKNPLSGTNTPPAEPPFDFKLHGRLVPAYSRVQPGEEKDPSSTRRGSAVRLELATNDAGPDA